MHKAINAAVKGAEHGVAVKAKTTTKVKVKPLSKGRSLSKR